MNFRFRIAGIAVSCMLGTGLAMAQYTGPGAKPSGKGEVARSVSEVLADARDDRPVELSGQLVRQTGRELYLFRDASGEITVEIDDDDFPTGQQVDADTQVKIHGEVDARAMREPRVEVERLEITTGR